VTQHRPDLVAVDLSLPDGSGLPLIEHLGSIAPDMRIVVLSMHDGEPYVSEAMRRGARGYVTKGVAPEELVAAVRAVLAGDQYLSSDLRERRSSRTSQDLDPFSRLTAREREVFLLLAAGRAPKQVAAELGIGQKTIYIHRAAVMNKLNAGSELDLYRMAQERGLIRS
jgi:Response regulator containing a CheY-like receiver domain and an HTH DNA-binding domain